MPTASTPRTLHSYLIELIEARFKVRCNGTHIRSHRGEPGNELVDTLASFAAHGNVTHDLSPFFQHVLCKAFADAGEWMWLLFAEEYSNMWNGMKIQLPVASSTRPSI